MTGLIVIGVIIVCVVVIGVVQAGVNAGVETLFDAMLRSAPERKRSSATFITAAPVAAAFEAVRAAAARCGAASAEGGPDGTSVIVRFSSGGQAAVHLRGGPAGDPVQLRLGSVGRVVDSSELASFRGYLLGALRERDPQARQK